MHEEEGRGGKLILCSSDARPGFTTDGNPTFSLSISLLRLEDRWWSLHCFYWGRFAVFFLDNKGRVEIWKSMLIYMKNRAGFRYRVNTFFSTFSRFIENKFCNLRFGKHYVYTFFTIHLALSNKYNSFFIGNFSRNLNKFF